MKKMDLAYIAGIMDADGWFTIKRNTYNIRVLKDSKNPKYAERAGIKQVQPEAIDLIYHLFGGYRRIEKPTATKGKPLHCLQLSDLKAHFFAKSLLPYLRIKKKQAEILIKLRQSLFEGKKGRNKIICKNRWGQMKEVTRAITSPKQVAYRESLIKEIKVLNDIRPHSYLPD